MQNKDKQTINIKKNLVCRKIHNYITEKYLKIKILNIVIKENIIKIYIDNNYNLNSTEINEIQQKIYTELKSFISEKTITVNIIIL